jgi:hypothetical protein
MTREAYDPERLDALALRLLDLSSQIRHLAVASRAAQLPTVELHDRKALEWIEKLEGWAAGAESDFERQTRKRAAAEKARQFR